MTETCVNGDGRPVAIPSTGECRRCYNARWRRDHPSYDRDRHAANREDDRAYQAAYRAAHRDEIRAKAAAAREARRPEIEAKRAERAARRCANGDGRPIEARKAAAE